MSLVDDCLVSAKPFQIRSYNCWHFFRDAWMMATGEDVGNRVPDSIFAYREAFENGTSARNSKIATPISPCIAYFPDKVGSPHIGMYWKGRILHLDSFGPHYEAVNKACARMGDVEYYL
jgi:hypothetical protein